MSTINAFLMSLGPEVRTTTWYAFIGLFVVIACILTGLYCFKVAKSQSRAVVCGIIAFIVFVFVILMALLVEKITNDYVLLSGVTYYIPYLFCASYVLSKYLKCSFSRIADYLSLAYLPARAINIIGCTIAGCCQGIPAEWGLYSAILKVNVIPVQLFESAAIFIIWLVLRAFYRRNQFSQDGRCALFSLILFGGLNALTDIFTYIQPKIIYMVSVEGVFAFITMCVGLVLLYLSDNVTQ